MAAADLRAEVEQAVARVDLPPPERQPVGAAGVDPGLARDRHAEPGCGDELAFAGPEEPGRVGKRLDGPPEPGLERDLGAFDLLPRRRVAEGEEVRMRERVRLEAEGAVAVQLDDLVPAEQRRLATRYQAKRAQPSMTAGATKTVARKPRSASSGSAARRRPDSRRRS